MNSTADALRDEGSPVSGHAAGWGDRTLHILKRTAQAFVQDNVTRLGAALAFYTTIAVAPLMVLAVAIAGLFLGEGKARATVLAEIRQVVGDQPASVASSLESPMTDKQGVVATVLGSITLIFGALGVFNHLQDALNSIWRAKPPALPFWKMVRYRLSSLAVVFATGFLLLVSLIASAILSWLAARALGKVEVPAAWLELINLGISFLATTLLFALLFKLLPDRHVAWSHVWLGAFVTALLFTVGKAVLGVYLGHAKVTSAYGAAGSLVALLLWCYYAAQIVFLGAEFTRVTAMSNGGRDFSPLDRPREQVRQASK